MKSLVQSHHESRRSLLLKFENDIGSNLELEGLMEESSNSAVGSMVNFGNHVSESVPILDKSFGHEFYEKRGQSTGEVYMPEVEDILENEFLNLF